MTYIYNFKLDVILNLLLTLYYKDTYMFTCTDLTH